MRSYKPVKTVDLDKIKLIKSDCKFLTNRKLFEQVKRANVLADAVTAIAADKVNPDHSHSPAWWWDKLRYAHMSYNGEFQTSSYQPIDVEALEKYVAQRQKLDDESQEKLERLFEQVKRANFMSAIIADVRKTYYPGWWKELRFTHLIYRGIQSKQQYKKLNLHKFTLSLILLLAPPLLATDVVLRFAEKAASVIVK